MQNKSDLLSCCGYTLEDTNFGGGESLSDPILCLEIEENVLVCCYFPGCTKTPTQALGTWEQDYEYVEGVNLTTPISLPEVWSF